MTSATRAAATVSSMPAASAMWAMSPDALARSRPDGSGVGSESPERTSVSRSTTLRAVSRPPIMPFRVPLAESFPLAGRSPVGREGYLFIYLFIYGSVTDDRAVLSPMTGLSGPGPCGPVLSSVSWIGLSPTFFSPVILTVPWISFLSVRACLAWRPGFRATFSNVTPMQHSHTMERYGLAMYSPCSFHCARLWLPRRIAPAFSRSRRARRTEASEQWASSISVSIVGQALRPSGWQRSARAIRTRRDVAVGHGASRNAQLVHCQLIAHPFR